MMKDKVRMSIEYMRRSRVGLLVLLITGLAGPTGIFAQTEKTDESPLKIVATHNIIKDWIKQVVGSGAKVDRLLGPAADSYTFEPGIKQRILLAEADLLFSLGLGSEPWLDALYQESGSRAKRIVLSSALDLPQASLPTSEAKLVCCGSATSLPIGEITAQDPYVWLDINNAITMVEYLEEVLIDYESNNTKRFGVGAERYITRLRELDLWVTEQVSGLSPEQQVLVIDHVAFFHFARRYGFRIEGVFFPSPIMLQRSLSPEEEKQIGDLILDRGLPAIFYQHHFPSPYISKLVKAVKERGTTIRAVPVYTQGLAKYSQGISGYEHMMQYNVKAIISALSKPLDKHLKKKIAEEEKTSEASKPENTQEVDEAELPAREAGLTDWDRLLSVSALWSGSNALFSPFPQLFVHIVSYTARD